GVAPHLAGGAAGRRDLPVAGAPLPPCHGYRRVARAPAPPPRRAGLPRRELGMVALGRGLRLAVGVRALQLRLGGRAQPDARPAPRRRARREAVVVERRRPGAVLPGTGGLGDG